MISSHLLISTKTTLSGFRQARRRAQVVNENEAERTKAKQQDAVQSSGVSLPVARTTGWSSGSSGGHRACRGRRAAGGSACVPPSRGGRRSPPAWATLWGSARHPPPTPATASTCFTLCPPVYSPQSFLSVSPPRCSLYRRTATPSPLLRVFFLVLFAPLGYTLPLGGWCLSGDNAFGESHVTARAVTTPVAGKLRSSADVASPRLDVDDDVDVHARSPARDAGTYHGIGPERISDVRQLQLKFEISIGWGRRATLSCLGNSRSHFVVIFATARIGVIERTSIPRDSCNSRTVYQLFIFLYVLYALLAPLLMEI